MERDVVRYAILALLGMLAISFAAATLPRTAEVGGGGSVNGSEGEFGIIPEAENSTGNASSLPAVPTFFSEFVGLIFLLTLLGSVLAVLREPRHMIGHAVRSVVLLIFALIVAFLLALFIRELLEFLTGGSDGSTGLGGGSGGGIDVIAGETAVGGVSVPTLAIVLGAVAVLLVAGVLALRRESATGEDATLPEPDETARRIGSIAGRAADRIESAAGGDDAAVDNEIFRAWREMTDLLEVDRPDSSTPAEFARAAVEHGMAPADVEELTALFREVRYGDAAPTAEREERAVAALRRIEDAYAEPDDA